MANGVKNTFVGIGLGLAIGAAALFTPSSALSKIPKSAPTPAKTAPTPAKTTPTPAAVHEFNKEKNKIEKSKIGIERTSISKSGLACTGQTSYSIPGLSVEPATTETLVRRLEHAQVIIQAIDHGFDAGRDKHTSLLRQLQEQGNLNIGAVLIEEFPHSEQDSLTAFYTTGKPNKLTEAVAYSTHPRGPNTQYSLMLLLAEARALNIELIGIDPDTYQPKYEFMEKTPLDRGRYVKVSNPDMLSIILEQLALHPGRRIVVQVGSGHVQDMQAKLSSAGISSASVGIWMAGIDVKQEKESRGDWVAHLLNQAKSKCAKYMSRLRAVSSDVLIDKVSPTTDFILYSPDTPLSKKDYLHLMSNYFE